MPSPRRACALGAWLLLLAALALLPTAPAPAPAPLDLPRAVPAAEESFVGDSHEMEALVQRERFLARVGVERWHALGFRGKGVKVAVLDSGFRGYRDQLGKSLPAAVTVKSFRADGDLEGRDSQHGILCAEVVHALAPDAELLLANWEADDPDSFLDAVRWARRQGARVLSCSLIMPGWGDGEGGGPVHEALADILGAGSRPGDVLFAACAGNVARRHWSGAFHAGDGGWHEWRPGEPDNRLAPLAERAEEGVTVELSWKAGPDYQIVVFDDGDGSEVARSPARKGPHCSAAAHFRPQPKHAYRFRVRQTAGEPGRFHCVGLGANFGTAEARGSVCFPADGPTVLAVGACDGEGHRLSYSSCGPNSTSPKPDLVAPVPFPSLWRVKPFAGTSAAAPQAAALAALWLSRHPTWTPDKVRAALRSTARDLGSMGHSPETGYGLLQLPVE